MSDTFSPAQVGQIVTKTTGYHLDPKTLRQWRNRGLFRNYTREDDAGWTRYTIRDVFEVAFMAEMIRAGYTARTAGSAATTGRQYGPGDIRWDMDGQFLVLPGITSDDEDGEAHFMHRVVCHASELTKTLASLRDRAGARVHIVIDLSALRQRFDEAVAGVGNG